MVLQPQDPPPELLRRLGNLVPAPEPQLGVVPTALGANGGVLRVSEPDIGPLERKYVLECLDTGWISSQGPMVSRFERSMAEAIGVKHAIACSSGTAALHLLTASLGLGPGDEVILPALTMVATINAVAYTGAVPVLVDVSPDTGNIDPRAVAAAISDRTRAVIAVHLYGHPAPMAELQSCVDGRGIVVLEDAAEAPGARYRGKTVGSIGVGGAFSFYANKILTTGEGGLVTTDDDELAVVARTMRDHAFSPDRHFWHRYVGFNYRMTALQAAVGCGQAERFEEMLARRAAIARRYLDGLRSVTGIDLPVSRDDVERVWWMFTILLDRAASTTRDDLRLALAAKGVETRTFFVPLHVQPVWYRQFADLELPVSEDLSRRGLYLPSSSTLTESQIDYVVECVAQSVRH